MATWSISPTDATINNNGEATFPENTGTTNKDYTITYVDDNGCSVSTTYTVPSGSTCIPCRVRYTAAGYPEDCTFTCNGQTKVEPYGYFDLPSGSGGAYITVQCPSDKIALNSSLYVLCSRTANFEIYEKKYATVTGVLSTNGIITFTKAPEDVPTVDIEFSYVYLCDENRYYETGATFINDTQEVTRLTDTCPMYGASPTFYDLDLTSLTFPETGTGERYDSGSYTYWIIQ